MHRRGVRGVRWSLRGAGTALVAVVVVGLAPGTAAAAPDRAVSQAQAARDAAAARVGDLSAQLASAQAAADAAHQSAQIALQEYEVRRAAQEAAQAAADAAAAAAAQAQAELDRGRADVVAFARSSYMRGSTSPGAAALMSATGPAELIQRAGLLDAVGTHRVDVVAQLTALEEQASAAETTAQVAVQEATAAETEAAGSLESAKQQEIAARAQAETLVQQQEVWEAELAEAQETLYGAQGAQAAREAAESAAAAAQVARSRPPAAASTTATGGSSSGSSSGRPPAPGGTTAGVPSGSAVQTAIAAAQSQAGVPYSWGGGGKNGPSKGLDPDQDLVGFDCSGLMEYAYGKAGISVGGVSRDQWWNFRNRTVAASDLRAGDLVFWASGSDYTTIYHVALYIGNNKVIQAPQSGDVVRTSQMWFGTQYFGAVRPTG
ncbi:C40 family peptidase [Geodermatophilus sp. CPCC 206100]|uniref:C40 family peptidase n=1 Tax=Geodermatophilus sp. CPCC 206100 TaxID=3020054 RepID=UPI003B00F44B